MIEARSRHEIFETEYQLANSTRFRGWWASRWCNQINAYARLGWAMIPIGVRGKLPLKAQANYESKGAAGPYLTVEEAYGWVLNGFNLAVAAGPSKIVWCDMDAPQLFNEDLNRGLVMRTPRGYAIPLLPDESMTEKVVQHLKRGGYDFREDITYELVPLSETCMFDHHLEGKRHPGPRESCLNSPKHDYRVREWITPLTNPILSFRDLLKVVKA